VGPPTSRKARTKAKNGLGCKLNGKKGLKNRISTEGRREKSKHETSTIPMVHDVTDVPIALERNSQGLRQISSSMGKRGTYFY